MWVDVELTGIIFVFLPYLEMSSSSSDSESEVDVPTTNQVVSRLGDCEVCGSNNAIYTCPKCEVKSCSLKCVVIHKKELECDGIRDRTKFIRMKDFTDTDLLSDYRLLEECSRFAYAVKRSENKRFTRIDKDLPIHLFKLKMAARNRGTALQFLAQNFTRHSINTTRYNFKSNVIHWRVECIFPNAEPNAAKFVTEKCLEQTRLSQLLDKYLNVDAEPFEGSKVLTYYRAAGFNGVKVLLRAEKVKGSSKKFFELDPTESLAENLSGKCVVEFPIIFVVLKDHAYNFEVITPEDEFHEDQEINSVIKEQKNSKLETTVTSTNGHYQNGDVKSQYNVHQRFRKRPRELLTQKIAKEKKEEIENEIKAEKKKRPKNLLFTTGYSSEESIGVSDDDNDK